MIIVRYQRLVSRMDCEQQLDQSIASGAYRTKPRILLSNLSSNLKNMSRSHMVKILAAKSYGQEVTGISGRV